MYQIDLIEYVILPYNIVLGQLKDLCL